MARALRRGLDPVVAEASRDGKAAEDDESKGHLAEWAAAADRFNVGDAVLVGKAQGTVRYKGETMLGAGAWLGIELDKAKAGAGDGSVSLKLRRGGRTRPERYFTCAVGHGTFHRGGNVQPFSKKHLAAALLQPHVRGHTTRSRLRRQRNHEAFVALDEDLEVASLRIAQVIEEHAPKHRHDAYKRLPRAKIDAIEVPETYAGVHLTFPMTFDGAAVLLASMRKGHGLHAKYTLQLLDEFHKQADTFFNTVHDLDIHKGEQLVICGDLHGQWDDLMTIIDANGPPSPTNRYLFNGDVVDRGPHGVEICLLIMAYHLAAPNAVTLNRGNHEDVGLNFTYGFMDEVLTKFPVAYREPVFWAFERAFKVLPLATVVKRKVFVVHGGLSRHFGVTLRHINSVERRQDIPPNPMSSHSSSDRLGQSIFEDLMWSDPAEQQAFVAMSPRGAGVVWGKALTEDFLHTNALELVIRSHEPPHNGFEWHHGRRVLTLFSASRYCGNTNKGAFMVLQPDLTYKIKNFVVGEPRSGPEAEIPRDPYHLVNKLIIEQVCVKKSALYTAFHGYDFNEDSKIKRSQWAKAMQQVTQLNLPWISLFNRIVPAADQAVVVGGSVGVDYVKFLDRYSIAAKAGWQDAVVHRIVRRLYKYCHTEKEFFAAFDEDEDGKIQYHEFVHQVKRMDLGLPDGQIFDLARAIDTGNTGYITMREFKARFELDIAHELRHDDAGWAREKLKQIGHAIYSQGYTPAGLFDIIDTNKDRTVDLREFGKFLGHLKLAVPLTTEEVARIFRSLDVAGRGHIDSEIFHRNFTLSFQESPGKGGRRRSLPTVIKPRELPKADTRRRSVTIGAPVRAQDSLRHLQWTRKPSFKRESAGEHGSGSGAGAGAGAGAEDEAMPAEHKTGGGLPDPTPRGPPGSPPLAGLDGDEVMAKDVGDDDDSDGGSEAYDDFDEKGVPLHRLNWQRSAAQNIINQLFSARVALKTLWRRLDTSGTGKLTRKQFRDGLHMVGMCNEKAIGQLKNTEMDDLIDAIDADMDGFVSWEEFYNAFHVVDTAKNEAFAPAYA